MEFGKPGWRRLGVRRPINEVATGEIIFGDKFSNPARHIFRDPRLVQLGTGKFAAERGCSRTGTYKLGVVDVLDGKINIARV